jgi:EpsI family protein
VNPTYQRLIVALALLLGTNWYLQARSHGETVPLHMPLSTFPMELATWRGVDLPIDPESREVLGQGEFLLRRYTPEDPDAPPADLFIAYFASQRTGETMHSPKNCLPGSGWSPAQNRIVTLQIPGVAPFPVNEYVVVKGAQRQLVLYWYLSHGRGIASEYSAKIHLVLDAIKMNRSDGSLIRISTPMLTGETLDAAMQRLSPFAEETIPKLDGYIPR